MCMLQQIKTHSSALYLFNGIVFTLKKAWGRAVIIFVNWIHICALDECSWNSILLTCLFVSFSGTFYTEIFSLQQKKTLEFYREEKAC